jgi:hypothetical protein
MIGPEFGGDRNRQGGGRLKMSQGGASLYITPLCLPKDTRVQYSHAFNALLVYSASVNRSPESRMNPLRLFYAISNSSTLSRLA